MPIWYFISLNIILHNHKFLYVCQQMMMATDASWQGWLGLSTPSFNKFL